MAQRPRAEFAAAAQWAPWAPVVPTWTASGTDPAIVNGTIVASCRRIGTVGFYRGVIRMGSSTTYGTGQWSVSLPDGWVASTALSSGYQSGPAECYQASTTAAGWYAAPGDATLTFWYGATRLAVSGSAPAAWGANQFLAWNATLELDADLW